MRVAGGRALTGAARELDSERRVLERLNPAARLASSRQLAGDLLDRASRAIRIRLATTAATEDRLASALPQLAALAVGSRGAALNQAAAALAVLGPQATLERGYGIVRRTSDDAIVRDPAQVSGGSRLRIRVARGEFPATADDPKEG